MIRDEDVPYSIVVKNITAKETMNMLKVFAMFWSIQKSLKQHFFTNSEAATGGVLRKKVFLENSP